MLSVSGGKEKSQGWATIKQVTNAAKMAIRPQFVLTPQFVIYVFSAPNLKCLMKENWLCIVLHLELKYNINLIKLCASIKPQQFDFDCFLWVWSAVQLKKKRYLVTDFIARSVGALTSKYVILIAMKQNHFHRQRSSKVHKAGSTLSRADLSLINF